MSDRSILGSRKITPFDVLALILGLALLVSLRSFVAEDTSALPAPPTSTQLPNLIQSTTEDASQLRVQRGAPRWLAALPAYQAWVRGAAHYGAFAVSDAKDYGWVLSYNDPDIARQTAVAFCERHAATPCRVVAVVEPRIALGERAVPMSARVARMFAENNARDGFRDFALAEDGTWGMAWGYPTHAEARRAALTNCRAHIRDRAEDLPPVSCRLMEWRRRDIQRAIWREEQR